MSRFLYSDGESHFVRSKSPRHPLDRFHPDAAAIRSGGEYAASNIRFTRIPAVATGKIGYSSGGRVRRVRLRWIGRIPDKDRR